MNTIQKTMTKTKIEICCQEQHWCVRACVRVRVRVCVCVRACVRTPGAMGI